MKEVKDIEWFKKQLALNLKAYELIFKFFEQGDFGSLSQVEFNSEKVGGNIDFWGLGWLGIFVWSYETEEELLNVLIEPQQENERENAFKRLEELLHFKNNNGI
jgi:hypothetical protein